MGTAEVLAEIQKSKKKSSGKKLTYTGGGTAALLQSIRGGKSETFDPKAKVMPESKMATIERARPISLKDKARTMFARIAGEVPEMVETIGQIPQFFVKLGTTINPLNRLAWEYGMKPERVPEPLQGAAEYMREWSRPMGAQEAWESSISMLLETPTRIVMQPFFGSALHTTDPETGELIPGQAGLFEQIAKGQMPTGKAVGDAVIAGTMLLPLAKSGFRAAKGGETLLAREHAAMGQVIDPMMRDYQPMPIPEKPGMVIEQIGSRRTRPMRPVERPGYIDEMRRLDEMDIKAADDAALQAYLDRMEVELGPAVQGKGIAGKAPKAGSQPAARPMPVKSEPVVGSRYTVPDVGEVTVSAVTPKTVRVKTAEGKTRVYTRDKWQGQAVVEPAPVTEPIKPAVDAKESLKRLLETERVPITSMQPGDIFVDIGEGIAYRIDKVNKKTVRAARISRDGSIGESKLISVDRWTSGIGTGTSRKVPRTGYKVTPEQLDVLFGKEPTTKVSVPEVKPVVEPAKPVETPKAKEPWEITRDDWYKEFNKPYPPEVKITTKDIKFVRGRLPGGIGYETFIMPDGSEYVLHRYKGKMHVSSQVGDQWFMSPQVASTGKGNIGQIKQYLADVYNEGLMRSQNKLRERYGDLYHKASVERALREGKRVPPEVLADYPDLAAKYAPETRPTAPETVPVKQPEVKPVETPKASAPETAKPATPTKASAPETAKPATPEITTGQAEPSVTGARKSITEPERAARGKDPVEMQEYKTYSSAYKQGKKAVDSGKVDPRTLADEVAEKPRVLKPEETGALVYERQRMNNALKEAYAEADRAITAGDKAAYETAKDQIEALLDALDKNDQALKRGGREASAALSAYKMVIKEDYSLTSLLQRKRVKEGRPLTEREQAKIVELHAQLEEATRALDKYRAESAEIIRMMNPESMEYGAANRIVTKQKAMEIEARLKAKLSQVGSSPDVTIVADLAELLIYHLEASARWTGSALRQYLKEKHPNLTDDIIDEAFKKAEADKRLTRAANRSAARTRTPKKMTEAKKLEMAKRRMEADLKRVTEAIEAVEQGKPLPKSPKKLVYDKEAKQLLAELQKARAKLKSLMPKQPSQMTEAKKVELAKKRIENRIAQLQQALKTGKPIPKKKAAINAEIVALQEQAKKLQADYNARFPKKPLTDTQRLEATKKRLQDQIKQLNEAIAKGEPLKPKRTPVKLDAEASELRFKVHQLKTELDMIVNPAPKEPLASRIIAAHKTLMTMLDLSAALRQGAMLMVGEPKAYFKAFKAMFRYAFSEKKFFELHEWINNHKYAPELYQSGLYIAPDSPRVRLKAREEAFQSRAFHGIPGFGNIVRGGERAYNGFLNYLRAQVFFKYVEAMPNAGLESMTRQARFINEATGRGTLGGFERSAMALANVFFSPRFVTSRIQVWRHLFSKDPVVRKMAAKNLVGFTGAFLLTLKLAEWAGADVELDPRSNEFGKIRIGKTHIDLSAAMVPHVRYAAQIMTGTRKVGNHIEKINRADVAWRFVQSKFGPTAGFITSVLKGKNFVGEDYTLDNWRGVLFNELTPMAIQDIIEAAREEGWIMGAAIAPIAIFGGSVTTYQPETYEWMGNPKDKAGKEVKRLGLKVNKTSEYYMVDGEKVELTDEQAEKLHRRVGNAVRAAILARMASQSYKQLSDKDKAKVLEKAADDARAKVRDKMRSELGLPPKAGSSSPSSINNYIRGQMRNAGP